MHAVASLQTYITMVVGNDTTFCRPSLRYLQGQGFIYTGELDKAFWCFRKAFHAIGALTCAGILSVS